MFIVLCHLKIHLFLSNLYKKHPVYISSYTVLIGANERKVCENVFTVLDGTE